MPLNRVRADDGGPDTNFWVKDNKITCFSVVNPESISPDSFLLFDYSRSIGENLGKPWSIIEKGRCYQIDKSYETSGQIIGGSEIYQVKIVDGSEKKYYSDYHNFSPSQNLQEGINVTPIEWFRREIGISMDEYLHFTGIHAESLFPTKYVAGYPFTSFTSNQTEEFGAILDDATFIAADNLYQQLATGLETAIQTCDSRKRIEYQFEVASDKNLSLGKIIWKLENNFNYVINPNQSDTRASNGYELPLVFERLQLMGCQKAFGEYETAHKSDFARFDLLADQLREKYPTSPGGWIGLNLSKRDDRDLELIGAFANNSYVPEKTLPLPTVVSDKETKSTVLDEPTAEKKTDIIRNSNSSILAVYFLMPFIAAAGITWFFLKKRKRH